MATCQSSTTTIFALRPVRGIASCSNPNVHGDENTYQNENAQEKVNIEPFFLLYTFMLVLLLLRLMNPTSWTF